MKKKHMTENLRNTSISTLLLKKSEIIIAKTKVLTRTLERENKPDFDRANFIFSHSIWSFFRHDHKKNLFFVWKFQKKDST